jgi:hypothetical protein
MGESPVIYGYKDLTPLGRALDENKVLQKKLELAIDFMIFGLVHEYYIDEYNMFHKPMCRKCAADKVLEEIKKIK